MEKFKTITEKCISAEIVEKKSRFIANLFFVDSACDAENKIKLIKKKYFDAKHNCYAYIINKDNEVTKKSSDDGEPSGTAGAPMLEILEKNNMANVLIIVTRYFGGILLGTGGLVRAYSDSLKKAMGNATFATQEHGYELDITLEYTDFENFKYYCGKNNIMITGNEYLDKIICKIELNDTEKERLYNDYENQNKLRIKKIDNIRQKNVICLSENVD
ncbi:MAG: YigZ family protein [Clostridia bacterium]|nr:YigZ family protein [Clostridia bacterium]